MEAKIIQFPTSPLYDARIEFARRVEKRMHDIEEEERKRQAIDLLAKVYAGERPCDCEEK
ncbi:MAG: hypothetical protein KIT32_12165 [Rhodocyclaceae bacterium]|nr:hypothetical protein [Rhodocyclaceae bacterium]